MHEKLKSLLVSDQLFYGTLLSLVALGSFALGRLSAVDLNTKNSVENVAILSESEVFGGAEENLLKNSESSSQTTSLTGDQIFVGSKSGTKYHRSDCPGAKQIKPINLITFNSQEEAEAAGYTKAANCPGL